jgi:hypothetical protein
MAEEIEKPKKQQAKKDTPKEVEKPPKKEAKKFVVCDGKNITSRCGILSGGDQITSEMLSGGQLALDQLVKSGYVK